MKKWRNLMFVAIGLMFGVAGMCACSSKQAVMVRAEGEEPETSEVVPAEETTTEGEENWFKKNYETFIVPLLSGVSITSILTMATTIIFTIVKNKKLDQKVLLITQKASEKYQECEEKLVEIKEILGQVHEIYELTLNNEKVNSEAKAFLEEKVKYMVTVVDGNSERVNKIDDLIKIISLLAQLEGKVAKQSQEIVKSGIIEDINEITALVKKL